MYNFHIHFSNPWWLLLLIPAIALTLFPYFRLSKKHRRTRNRIISIILHLTVMILAISVLSGMEFRYQKSNDKNEVILLVDMSATEQTAEDSRDQFVESIIQAGAGDNFRIGVVTFGYNQNYAVPMTTDTDSIYTQYLDAELPDVSATNVASALTYAKDLFSENANGRIVLITDGKETDESMLSVIRAITAKGIAIDIAYVPSQFEGDDVQIIKVEYPDYHVNVGEACYVTVTVQSRSKSVADFRLTDNGTPSSELQKELVPGTQKVLLPHTFEAEGLHNITVTVAPDPDLLEENNIFTSYFDLVLYNNILIIESTYGGSQQLESLLTEGNKYNVTIATVGGDDFPETLEQLRGYDQIILNNVSGSDLDIVSPDFASVLSSYVKDCGGGLFTVGGNDSNGFAHAYNRNDMLLHPDYQQMLPIQVIDYIPPKGVVVIVDRSGSMTSTDGTDKTRVEWAMAGARACLDAMDDRDYFGFMTLDSNYEMMLPLTKRTEDMKIREVLSQPLTGTGGTVSSAAFARAVRELNSESNIDKRHVIIVTDGQFFGKDKETLMELVELYYKQNGITLSIVGIGFEPGSSADLSMQEIVAICGGRVHVTKDPSTLERLMREDLKAPDILEVSDEPFSPIISNTLSPVVNGIETDTEADKRNQLTFQLDGFYGAKKREGSDVVIVGNYEIPIYAQWKVGKGMVGSFMSDLNGTFSSDLLADPNGIQLVYNIINNLMPTVNIAPSDMTVKLIEDNYTNSLSIDASLTAGERIEGSVIEYIDGEEVVTSLNSVIPVTDNYYDLHCYTVTALGQENGYSRCKFVIKNGGVYKIVLNKVNSAGEILSSYECYKSLAYSNEYDTFAEYDTDAISDTLAVAAERGNGVYLANIAEDDPMLIFQDFITAIDFKFDPRFLFMIIAIILFLLDIAVRKFKFKWIHEIIREHKEKKEKQ